MGHVRSLALAVPRYVQLLRSQRWSRERLASYQQSRLREVLDAAREIPFYAQRFANSGEDFSSLPILERLAVPDLTRSVRETLPAGMPILSDRSSASTGMPREFLFDETHQRGRFAARMRYLLANGWNPLRRCAWVIFLPEGTPDGRLVRNRLLLGQHFFSALEDVDEQLAWLRYIDPEILYTLPSNLGLLLERLEGVEEALPSLRRVLTGGEVVDDALRVRTREQLGVEIGDNYGSTEAFMAWQCRSGRYHVNAEHVLLEIVDSDGQPTAPGELGRVLITTLENRLCPLVRYAIGDHAEPGDGACPCGLTLPLLGRAAGRAINLFHLADGRAVTPWGLIVSIRNVRTVDQFQVVQKTIDRFTLRHVTPAPLDSESRQTVTAHFHAELGPNVSVEFERVEAIERSPTGKFMTAVSEVDR